ncbi:hypothetical protein CsatB_030023 [Cannabis sativa]|uniref:uncharacterized protein LOC115720431 n=1 Tax=Cannabis sativa TaxID=3483 RepID=UPI0011DF0956|nr:uncharacterized protein LOC115720431 [Cannabis sativa]
MALKLDMSKAYDRMEWGYLRAVLLRMGFDGRCVNLIMHCVESGNPISPYLFILCAEGFSGLLRKYEVDGKIHGSKVARRAPVISHMLLADDSYFFCRANTREADSIMELLHLYEQASGQRVNFEKSFVFFSSNTEVIVRDSICGQLEIYEADDNTTYLGRRILWAERRLPI